MFKDVANRGSVWIRETRGCAEYGLEIRMNKTSMFYVIFFNVYNEYFSFFINNVGIFSCMKCSP